MTRLPAALVLLAVLGATAAGCAGPVGGAAGPRAVASVYPLAWVAEQVAPEADVTFLAAGGRDAHDLELSPTERALLDDADVVLYLGPVGFQPQIEQAIDGRTHGVVAAAAVVDQAALLQIGAVGDRDHAGEGAPAGVDPHLWFDAGLMATVAERTGDAFAAADPAGAARYQAGAARVAGELRALDEEIAGLLSGCRFDRVVVSHAAYAYLLEPHGLVQVGVSPAGGHSEPSPRDIADLAQLVRETGLAAVLTESAEGRAGAEAVAREAGVGLVEIASIDLVNDAQERSGYPELLRAQAEAVARVAQCLGG
jgi:zinc transport system substrate-binding protein